MGGCFSRNRGFVASDILQKTEEDARQAYASLPELGHVVFDIDDANVVIYSDTMAESLRIKLPPQGTARFKTRAEMLEAFPTESVGGMKRSNSTSSFQVESTLGAPNADETKQAVSLAILAALNINQFRPSTRQNFKRFSEEYYPMDTRVDHHKIPDLQTIFNFVKLIDNTADMSAECNIIALIYMDRMLAMSGCTLEPQNWRRITMCALLLSAKVWEEESIWNIDFRQAFPRWKIDDLNELEKEFLGELRFSVGIKASLYAAYFYELRSMFVRAKAVFQHLPSDTKAKKSNEDLLSSKGDKKLEKLRRPNRSWSSDTLGKGPLGKKKKKALHPVHRILAQ